MLDEKTKKLEQILGDYYEKHLVPAAKVQTVEQALVAFDSMLARGLREVLGVKAANALYLVAAEIISRNIDVDSLVPESTLRETNPN